MNFKICATATFARVGLLLPNIAAIKYLKNQI